jgi:hypothetical protein
LETKKGNQIIWLPLGHEMSTKKGKSTPISIRGAFACDLLLYHAGYLSHRQELPYIKPSNYRLVFGFYPVKRFVGSPQLAGTTALWTRPQDSL